MMKRRICFMSMCVFAVLGLASTALAAVEDWVIIKVPLAPTFGYANNTRTDEDDEMMYGMVGKVTAIGANSLLGGELYLINTQYDYPDGYLRVAAGEFDLVSADEAEAWRDAQTHWVISNFADVLSEKNLDAYPPLITLPKGSLLKVTYSDSDSPWSTVELRGGRIGYIRTDRLRAKRSATDALNPAHEDEIRTEIVSNALSYINSNYRWAGKTPLGLDCSGLSSMAYMLSGINSYRNSRPEPGNEPVGKYPIALKHIDTPANDPASFDIASTHTLESLAKAKPGDMLYWNGHQGIYIGNGEFVHANGGSASCRVNSLIPDRKEPAPTRNDLNTYCSIYTWGTAFPDEPEKIIVDRLILTRTDTMKYRIVARINGYVPNRAEFYPCGVDESGSPLGYDGTTATPIIHEMTTPANVRYMLFDVINTTNNNAPTFMYDVAASGQTYIPAIKFFNETGYRPLGETIVSEIFEMPTTFSPE
ncbi:MAG: C40 family peptidase [Synergistaceae bacterium]|jgi:cell wall-associated NlpC family hydrolase|nr:C40 family peptidase [Synergistaceae bacterium]